MGGKVVKKLGDGLMALFGYPSGRYVQVAIQRALADLKLKTRR
jgi:class 3 adenylate cyclase